MLYSCSHGHTHTIKSVLHVAAHLQSINLLPVKQTRIVSLLLNGDGQLFLGPLSSPLLNGHFFKMYHTSAKVES